MDDDPCECRACRLRATLADPDVRAQLRELAVALAQPEAWSIAELAPPLPAVARTHRLAPGVTPPGVTTSGAAPGVAPSSTTRTAGCTDPACACPPSPAHPHRAGG